MYVKIGPYSHWFQPATWLQNWILRAYGFGKNTDWDKAGELDRHDAIKKWIRSLTIYKWLDEIECWIDNRSTRKAVIKIHYYDVWSMDHTLSLIILPMLKLLKEKKHGAPFVDDDDVPEELRSTAAPPCEEWETDDNHFKRWDWVMDEMIWTFEQLVEDGNDSQFFHYPNENQGNFDNCDFNKDAYTAHHYRIDRGLRLFGKYFRGLWD